MRLALLALSCLLATSASAQVPVRFEVEVPGTLAPYDTVFLAGTFNGWNPGNGMGDGAMSGRHPMERVGDDRFALTVEAPAGDTLEYKYTLGAWAFVERDADDENIDNRRLVAAPGAVARDTVARWAFGQASIDAGRWLPEHLTALQNWTLAPRLFAHFDTTGYPDSTWTPDDVDRHVDMMAAWLADAAPGVDADITAGNHIYLATGSLPDDAAVYWLETYALPAALREWPYYRDAPPSDVRWGDAQALLNYFVFMALSHDLDEQMARETYAAVQELPAFLDRYAAAGVLSEHALPLLADARSAIDGQRLLWDLRFALMEERYDEASALLAHALDAYPDGMTIFLGFELAKRQATSDPDAALATLDLIARNTSAFDLSTSGLRNAYARIVPGRGAARFDAVASERPASVLPLAESQPVPDGQYLDLQSDTLVDLAAFEGETVLLDFWTTWCGPCIAEMPDLNQLHVDLDGQPGIRFLSVNADAVTTDGEAAAVRAMIEQRGLVYPVLFDTPEDSLVERFGVYGYPTKLLIEPDGSVREVGMGSGISALRALLAERGFLDG